MAAGFTVCHCLIHLPLIKQVGTCRYREFPCSFDILSSAMPSTSPAAMASTLAMVFAFMPSVLAMAFTFMPSVSVPPSPSVSPFAISIVSDPPIRRRGLFHSKGRTPTQQGDVGQQKLSGFFPLDPQESMYEETSCAVINDDQRAHLRGTGRRGAPPGTPEKTRPQPPHTAPPAGPRARRGRYPHSRRWSAS